MRSHSVVLTALIVSGSTLCSANAQPRSDRHGDPLPAGAITRLGSAKFIHGEPTVGLSLSPDGSFALGADEGHVVLWDTATGRQLREFKGMARAISAALSPDGKLVAASDNVGRIWIWDAKTGEELRKLVGKAGIARILAWSADSKWIAGYADDRVNLWVVASGELLHAYKHRGDITRLAISPDGKYLVSGKSDEASQILWDIASEKELRRLPGYPALRIANFGFAPDSKSIVGYFEERTGNTGGCYMRRWDVETGKKLRDYDGCSFGLAGFSPGGQTFIAASYTTIRLCDTESGKIQREWNVRTNYGRMVLSGDGKLLAVDVAGRIRLWNPDTGQEVRPPAGHLAGVRSVSFSRDGNSVVSGSIDDTVRIWDWTTARETKQHRWENAIEVRDLQHNRDGTVAGSAPKGRILIWNPTDDRVEKEFAIGKSIQSLTLHPDGKTIVTAGDREERIAIWNTGDKGDRRDLEPFATLPKNESRNAIRTVSLSDDGRSVAFTDSQNNSGITDIATGQRTVFFEDDLGKRPRVDRLLFSPACEDGRDAERSRTLEHPIVSHRQMHRRVGQCSGRSSRLLSRRTLTCHGLQQRTRILRNRHLGCRSPQRTDPFPRSLAPSECDRIRAAGSGNRLGFRRWHLARVGSDRAPRQCQIAEEIAHGARTHRCLGQSE